MDLVPQLGSVLWSCDTLHRYLNPCSWFKYDTQVPTDNMCRWIAFIGHQPMLLEDLLIDAPHPITAQVHSHYLPDNPEGPGKARYNFDGFGVTWYTDTRSLFDSQTDGPSPARYRTTAIAVTDQTFTSVCANSASNCILAHVRAASRPPVVETNNHPFTFGRHSFMHNGTIAEFPAIRLAMLGEIRPEYAKMIEGNTDTEHFAALYFTFLGDIEQTYCAKEMRNAMGKALWKLRDIQIEVLGYEPINSMNLCATDGENLVALRWRNNSISPVPLPWPGGDEPLSLYVSYDAAASIARKHRNEYDSHHTKCTPEQLTENATPALKQRMRLNQWNPHGPHVIVASEPATFIKNQWYSLTNGQFIMVDRKGVLHWDGTSPLNKPNRDSKDTVGIGSDPVLNDKWGVQLTFDNLNLEKEKNN